MSSSAFGIIDIFLLISVLLINYCFFSMWNTLYGGWIHFRPTWKWLEDFRRLKLLASQADSAEVRDKCHLIIVGFKFSVGLLLVGILFGLFIK